MPRCCHERRPLELRLQAFRLPSFLAYHQELATCAQDEAWSYVRYLEELATLEAQDRADRRIARLMKTSKLPRDKTLSTLDVARWPRSATSWCARAHSVFFTTVQALVERLLAAKRNLRLSRELRRLGRFDCLCLDDVGYVQQERAEMEVLFTLLAERYDVSVR